MFPSDNDRVAMLTRPQGRPIMHQSWGKLLFIHWPIDPKLLRPLVPTSLEIDTFEGSAWIAVAPFTMWDIRALPHFLPRLPGLSSMHELNVRTYVYMNNTPGVWFFSLDCNSASAVLAARTFFFLPYYNADIDLEQHDNEIKYSLKRTEKPRAEFSATWNIGKALPRSEPGTLPFFLTERYCLYSQRNDKLYRGHIHHEPWSLRQASLSSFNSTMIDALGVPAPGGEPVLHYAEEISVDIWPLEAVK